MLLDAGADINAQGGRYTLPFRVSFEPFQFHRAERSPLDLFLLFCTLQVLDWIVENTNSVAAHWRPDAPGEVISLSSPAPRSLGIRDTSGASKTVVR
jgi:hypothetical protein